MSITAKNYNIVRKAEEENYQNRRGENKTPYKQVGEMVKFTDENGGSWYRIKLNWLPEEFQVFEKTFEKKEKIEQKEKAEVVSIDEVYPNEEVNPKDIPF